MSRKVSSKNKSLRSRWFKCLRSKVHGVKTGQTYLINSFNQFHARYVCRTKGRYYFDSPTWRNVKNAGPEDDGVIVLDHLINCHIGMAYMPMKR